MVDVLPWFAIRVRPRYEKQVAQSIEAKGIPTFLPTYATCRRWSDRTKQVQVPLFDGYVFCRLDPDYRMPVLVTPGVFHFVGIGKTPVPVDDREMAAIQTAVQSGSMIHSWPFLREGDRVRINEGPLRNVEGILVRDADADQVVISITLLQRSLAVHVDRAWLTPIRSWLPDRQPSLPTSRIERRPAQSQQTPAVR